MKRFLGWRKMTWVILGWGALTAAWMLGGYVVLSLIVGLLGFVVLSVAWFMTRPLWRQGHGARFRRMPSVDVPFQSAAGLTSRSE